MTKTGSGDSDKPQAGEEQRTELEPAVSPQAQLPCETAPAEAAGAAQASAEAPAAEAEPSGESRSRRRRERLARMQARVRSSFGRVGGALERPVVGATVAGGLVAAAAGLWGPTEAALGALAGLTAYRVLKRRRRARAEAAAAAERRPSTGSSESPSGYAG